MSIIRLSPRLKAVADFIGGASCVADIGTDHGYIPIYLAQTGFPGTIIASDIREGPLSSAKTSAARFGVEGKIRFRLADGLSEMENMGIDTVIMAGMGGETITSVLGKAEWVRRKNVRLIVQPQTKTGEMSRWLHLNGYAIRDALLTKDGGRIYAVFLAGTGNAKCAVSGAYAHVDRLLIEKKDPLLPEYLDGLIKSYVRALSGMEKAIGGVPESEHVNIKSALEGFIEMKRGIEKW